MQATRAGILWAMTLVTVCACEAPQDRGPAAWEYKVVDFSSGRPKGTTEYQAQVLNDLADEGWEYVGPLNHLTTASDGSVLSSSQTVAFRRLR